MTKDRLEQCKNYEFEYKKYKNGRSAEYRNYYQMQTVT